MQPLVSSEVMKWCDETAISAYATPGLLLMDRAGIAAAHTILATFKPKDRSVIVFCGKGNNGGDGFVISRVLAENGARVTTVLVHSAQSLKGDAREHFRILKAHRAGPLSIISLGRFLRQNMDRPDCVVDAVFGTGFHGSPKGAAKSAIEWMNASGLPVIAVDVPSGIDATTGTVETVAVRAHTTVTFGAIKTGLVLNEGRECSGRSVCVDIGIPNAVMRDKRVNTFLVESSDVERMLPKRSLRAHKYSVGKVLVLAGSKGYAGAAALSAHAALRSGSGAVHVMTPEVAAPIIARKLTEEIVTAVPTAQSGTFGTCSLDTVRQRLDWADVVLVGPGISVTDDAADFLEGVFRLWKGPAVVDADALTLISQSRALQSFVRTREFILTPHTGEFARLSGSDSSSLERERITAARSFVKGKRAILVFKGAPTCVATPDGACYVNPTGNPGMATVGSGDVLAGVIAGLWAQGVDRTAAAIAGVFMHGRAGDIAKESFGERSLLARDILDAIPRAMTGLSNRS